MVSSQFEGDMNVFLIGFGLAIDLKDQGTVAQDKFHGNFQFASLEQMNLEAPSTHDDLSSICYLLMYLLNGCKFPLFDYSITLSSRE